HTELIRNPAGCRTPAIRSQAPSEPEAEVELALLAKDSLRNVPDELKGLLVLSSEGKYLVVGPPDVAPVYGDHSVPLEVVIARHKRRKNKLAPHPCYIHRLPTEVLCAIFLMCGDPNELFDYPRDEQTDPHRLHHSWRGSFHIRETMIIDRVCWRWHTITRGCPQLWTLIDIPLPHACDVAALKLSLEYSKGLTLTLRLNDFYHTNINTRSVKACRQFMSLIAASAGRWEEISIIVIHEPPSVSDLVKPLLELSRDSFTSLSRAILRFGRTDAGCATASRLWEVFYMSPVLRVVQWSHATPIPPAATFQGLTHVGVDLIYAEEIMGFLRACSQVQVLQAVVKPPPHIYPSRDDGYLIPTLPAPIQLPQLRILMLRGMSDWSNLFGGITPPNLHRLDISMGGLQAEAILIMLKRASARLRALSLQWIYPGHHDDVVTLLRSNELQGLMVLRYYGYDGYDLEPDHFDPSPYLPPHLHSLTKTYEDMENACRSLNIC
ncbi:hypothetical protein GGF50DRAFT_105965, partial [Schizophyllum commune]